MTTCLTFWVYIVILVFIWPLGKMSYHFLKLLKIFNKRFWSYFILNSQNISNLYFSIQRQNFGKGQLIIIIVTEIYFGLFYFNQL